MAVSTYKHYFRLTIFNVKQTCFCPVEKCCVNARFKQFCNVGFGQFCKPAQIKPFEFPAADQVARERGSRPDWLRCSVSLKSRHKLRFYWPAAFWRHIFDKKASEQQKALQSVSPPLGTLHYLLLFSPTSLLVCRVKWRESKCCLLALLSPSRMKRHSAVR